MFVDGKCEVMSRSRTSAVSKAQSKDIEGLGIVVSTKTRERPRRETTKDSQRELLTRCRRVILLELARLFLNRVGSFVGEKKECDQWCIWPERPSALKI